MTENMTNIWNAQKRNKERYINIKWWTCGQFDHKLRRHALSPNLCWLLKIISGLFNKIVCFVLSVMRRAISIEKRVLIQLNNPHKKKKWQPFIPAIEYDFDVEHIFTQKRTAGIK